jgi:hypothetical protein
MDVRMYHLGYLVAFRTGAARVSGRTVFAIKILKK